MRELAQRLAEPAMRVSVGAARETRALVEYLLPAAQYVRACASLCECLAEPAMRVSVGAAREPSLQTYTVLPKSPVCASLCEKASALAREAYT